MNFIAKLASSLLQLLAKPCTHNVEVDEDVLRGETKLFEFLKIVREH